MNRKQAAMRIIKEALIEDDAIRLADELESELSYHDDMGDFYDYVEDYTTWEEYEVGIDYEDVHYGHHEWNFELADDWGC